MGRSVAYIGTIGSDANGELMRAELARRRIETTHAVGRDAANPFAVILLDDHDGERVVLWRRDDGLVLQSQDVTPAVIRDARVVHVDDVDLEASVAAARMAREGGIPVTSDIEKTSDEVRALVDAVTVPIFAEHVPAALTGHKDLEQALDALQSPNHSMLAVTLGARGAMLLADGHLYREPGLSVKAVDTTGAGDVFRGAFIHALLRGDGPKDILRFANAAAALSCTKLGAMSSVPRATEVSDITTKIFKSTKDTNSL
jgi:sugar/nucleoside kinase (ribokinase family)